MDETEDKTTYKVVVNHEEQYSIRPADRANAPGWRDAGKTGDKSECLAYVKSVWTDLACGRKWRRQAPKTAPSDRPATRTKRS